MYLRTKLADLVMWLAQPSLAPMLHELARVQDQMKSRIRDLEERPQDEIQATEVPLNQPDAT